jgi:hypothetical protein
MAQQLARHETHGVTGEPEKTGLRKIPKEIAMPLFMDVHESLPEGATVNDVIGAHRPT